MSANEDKNGAGRAAAGPETTVFSAPGKLFLLGEYAVLEGAPAVLAAVDRRAVARTRRASGWHLHTRPDLSTGSGLGGAAVFDAVRMTIAHHCDLPPQDVVADTRDFFGAAGKLGLGASAAVAAALTGAFAAAGGLRLTRDELLELATAAHRRAQTGAGSGADVATAVHGGALDFAMDRAPSPLAWPDKLHVAAVVTGGGADTRKLIRAVRGLAEREPARYRELMTELGTLAERGRDAFASGDIAGFLDIADRYREALSRLGAAAAAGIVLPAHERLARLAAGAGTVFKTSGAGGGDLGLILADSRVRLTVAVATLRGAGFQVLEMEFGVPGLQADASGVK